MANLEENIDRTINGIDDIQAVIEAETGESLDNVPIERYVEILKAIFENKTDITNIYIGFDFNEWGQSTGQKALYFEFSDGSEKSVTLPDVFSTELNISQTEDFVTIDYIKNGVVEIFEIPLNSNGGGGMTPDGGEVILPSIDLDSTLTQEGMAADAKAVGERLNDIEYQTITTEQSYEHAELPTGEKTVTVYGDGTFGDTAYICTGEDFVPRDTFAKSFPYNGITITKEGYIYHITGTATATTTIFLGDIDGNLDIKSVKDFNNQTLKLVTFAEEILESNIRISIQFYDENGVDLSGGIKKTVASGALSNVAEITIPDGSAYMRVGLIMLKNVVFDNKIQVYLSLSDKLQSITDFHNNIVVDDADASNIITFPYPSALTAKISLRSYIDYVANNADGSDGDVIMGNGTVTYLTPEDFGAKGDGKTDDSEAINLCLERASASRKIVLMAQKYYIANPIVVGSNLNIIANRITYSGADTAVRIDGKRNNIKIHSISSSAVGIVFGGTEGISNLYNVVEINNITSQSHGIVFNAVSASMWQNTIKFSCITAGGTGCYGIADLTEEGNGYFVAETNVYGGQITNCEWAVYKCKGNSRFYNIQIEDNVQGGFYVNSGCTVFHPRIAESQRDGNLPIYKFSDTDHCTIYDSSGIYINQIDLSEATEVYHNGLVSEYHFGTINGRIISSNIEDGKPASAASVYSTKTYLWGRYLIFTPFADYIKVVTTNVLDTRLVGSETTPAEIREMTQLPTKFVVDNVSSEIYLHSSYCAFGYNEFEVEQANGFTCKVYDVKGTLIFDGTVCDNGVYKFKVYKDAQYCKQNSSGVLGYDFMGHYWEIKKSGDTVI